MSEALSNIYLISSIFGLLMSSALMLQLLKGRKGHFFLGIVVFVMAIELLFSWGALTGFNTPEVFPYWRFLNYWLFPPSIWLFVQFNTDDNFLWKPLHWILFVPALLVYVLEAWSNATSGSLMEYPLWVLFSDYLPLVGTAIALGLFWKTFYQHLKQHPFRSNQTLIYSQMRLLLLMAVLSIICLFWMSFSLIGWQHFEWIEFAITFLFLGTAFLHFLESQELPSFFTQKEETKYPEMNDEKELEKLRLALETKRYYLQSNLPLKALASELDLPDRYLSYLINTYHQKNYKEYINHYRINAFLEKAQSAEKDSKTLLGLALESGFSSKSTFNHVFKTQMGKSPKDYLKDL